MTGTLVRCIECNEVMNETEWDYYPDYRWHEGEIEESERNDRAPFLERHRGHTTEKLTPLTSPLSGKPYAEPVKASFFEATNGTERFVIKRWRKGIDEPFAYEIMEGRLEITTGSVRAQTAAIKRQLQAEKDSLISGKKVHRFIQAVRTEVEQLDPEALEVSAEGETPLISYHQLGDRSVDRILARCEDACSHHELSMLREFIDRHNEYDGVMTVVSKKEFAIKGRTQQEEYSRAVCSARRVSLPNP
jgi:hypothetical protein